MSRMSRGPAMLLSAALVLGGAGLYVEQTMTQPRMRTVEKLSERRQVLEQDATMRNDRMAEAEALAQALQITALDESAALGAGEEPVAFVGRLVADSGLQRIALLSGDAVVNSGIRSSRFTLRVVGRWSQLLDLVKSCEVSGRLVCIEALDIKARGQAVIEASLDLAVHDDVHRRTN